MGRSVVTKQCVSGCENQNYISSYFPCEKVPSFKYPEIAPNHVQGRELHYKFAFSYYDNTSTGHQIIVFIKIYYYMIEFSNIQFFQP